LFILLLLIYILAATAFVRIEFVARVISENFRVKINSCTIFSLILLCSFAIQVAIGITGSSFSISNRDTPFVNAKSFIKTDEIPIFGNVKPIRSDEHTVLTPSAIAQYNSKPQFPVINHNLGEEGQNMLITHMTSVPVWHISAIARPATWGFFFLDLRSALSWYWLFPIYGCLFAFWGVVATISKLDWRTSFLFSLWFCVSPYVAAWSNWPAYVALFPSLMFLCFVYIFKQESRIKNYLAGIVLGVAIAGFVLVLYPPWQITLGYLFVILSIAYFIREKLYQNFNAVVLQSLALSLLIAGAILYCWFIDARSAIELMSNTIYPGQRQTLSGGTVTLPWLLKGFTNFILYSMPDFGVKSGSGISQNPSEIASFYYLFIPIIFLFVKKVINKQIDILSWGLVIFAIFTIIFMCVGLPQEFARISLWGRLPAERADFALGVAYILLCALLLKNPSNCLNEGFNIIALLISIIWIFIVIWAIQCLPVQINKVISTENLVITAILTTVCGYYLASGQTKIFIYCMLGLSLASTFAFNPIAIATNEVSIKEPIKNIIDKDFNPSDTILVLEDESAAAFFAAGKHVINGIFYYPQFDFWKKLDPKGYNKQIYNRYYHLWCIGSNYQYTQEYDFYSPQADYVVINLNLSKFDFKIIGAKFIVAPPKYAVYLEKNTSIHKIFNDSGITWYQLN